MAGLCDENHHGVWREHSVDSMCMYAAISSPFRDIYLCTTSYCNHYRAAPQTHLPPPTTADSLCRGRSSAAHCRWCSSSRMEQLSIRTHGCCFCTHDSYCNDAAKKVDESLLHTVCRSCRLFKDIPFPAFP